MSICSIQQAYLCIIDVYFCVNTILKGTQADITCSYQSCVNKKQLEVTINVFLWKHWTKIELLTPALIIRDKDEALAGGWGQSNKLDGVLLST